MQRNGRTPNAQLGNLPNDILKKITMHLNFNSANKLGKTSKRMAKIVKERDIIESYIYTLETIADRIFNAHQNRILSTITRLGTYTLDFRWMNVKIAGSRFETPVLGVRVLTPERKTIFSVTFHEPRVPVAARGDQDWLAVAKQYWEEVPIASSNRNRVVWGFR